MLTRPAPVRDLFSWKGERDQNEYNGSANSPYSVYVTHGHGHGSGQKRLCGRHNLRCAVDQDGQACLYRLLYHRKHLVLAIDLSDLQRLALKWVQEFAGREGALVSGRLRGMILLTHVPW